MTKFFKHLFPLRWALFTILLLGSTRAALAGSATWDLAPISKDWNTAANWTPDTVPNGPSDTATFEISNKRNVSITSPTTLDGIVFDPGASPFTITVAAPVSLFISGVGVTNNSGVTQSFLTNTDRARNQATITFVGSATAGDATYTNFGGRVSNAFGGHVEFFNTATAGTGTFVIGGGAVSQADGAGVLFFDASSADSGTFNINGGAVNGAGFGDVEFIHTSTADRATLIADAGLGGGAGATIFFFDDSKGGSASVTVSGNGNLDISFHNPPGITIGSLQGDGLVFLGSKRLTVNSRSTITFAGVIADGGVNGGAGGALVKSGNGRLDLTGASTYTGGTTVTAGTLLVNNTSGSGTGTGPVQAKSGALGGEGVIAGAVTIGAGISGNGAFLTPGQSITRPGLLTILGSLTFDSDGFFNVGVARNVVVGQVVANGVILESGSTFAYFNSRGISVPVGTVLILINNTSAMPIAGVFDNLPDGLVFTDQGNILEVDYEGGDGNDLTLTSVP
jgi:autotransporter-associated beta strand protein